MAKHQSKAAKTVDLVKDDNGNYRYPRGWHCIGMSEEFTQDSPHSLEFFGTKLVAYRGEDGEVYVLDGYCPHLGADLGEGCIEGNSIRCAFHAWRWGADGKCDDIPYASNIPAKAVTSVWPVCEQDGIVFVWNDPEQGEPDHEFPKIPQYDDPQWSSWYWAKTIIETNQRELMDNVADVAHFGPVHNAPIKKFDTEFIGHKSIQYMEGSSEELADGGSLKTIATYYGPSRQDCSMKGGPIESYTANLHTAIDEQSFTLWYGVLVKKLPGQSDEDATEIAKSYAEAAAGQFYQDVEIWRGKTFITNPILCDGDGPFNKLRKWYQQFYCDRANVDAQWL